MVGYFVNLLTFTVFTEESFSPRNNVMQLHLQLSTTRNLFTSYSRFIYLFVETYVTFCVSDFFFPSILFGLMCFTVKENDGEAVVSPISAV